MCDIVSAVPCGVHRPLGRRCADAAADGGWRARHHLGGGERDTGGDGRRWWKRPSATTSPPRAQVHARILPLMAINFVESNPSPVKCRDGGDGPARGDATACRWCRRRPRRRRRSYGVLKDTRAAQERSALQQLEAVHAAALSTARHVLEADIRTLVAGRSLRRSRRRARGVRAAARGAVVRAGPRRGARRVEPDRLARQHRGSSRASCSASGSATSSTRRWTTGGWPFYDKDTLPLKKPGLAAGVRIVPGGSAIRDGAYSRPASSACRRCT